MRDIRIYGNIRVRKTPAYDLRGAFPSLRRVPAYCSSVKP
jgi:hypothetical protein